MLYKFDPLGVICLTDTMADFQGVGQFGMNCSALIGLAWLPYQSKDRIS